MEIYVVIQMLIYPSLDIIHFLHCFEGKIYGEATHKIFTELKTIAKIRKDVLVKKKNCQYGCHTGRTKKTKF